MADDIDLTSMTHEQTLTGLGDVLLSLLAENKVAVSVMSEDGAITFLNPLLIRHVPPEELAAVLLDSWDEAEVEKLLAHVYE